MGKELLIQIIGIGVAGALGALARYLVGILITKHVRWQIPAGTLLINTSGAFIIGLLSALAGRHLINPFWHALLTTGFLGGYTTFSTMQWESFILARNGGSRPGIWYLAGSLLIGLLATGLGLLVGRWI